MAMNLIKKPEKWLSGKTIKRVDNRMANGTELHFTDGTAVWVEAVHQGHGIFGPAYYEFDPTKPLSEQ